MPLSPSHSTSKLSVYPVGFTCEGYPQSCPKVNFKLDPLSPTPQLLSASKSLSCPLCLLSCRTPVLPYPRLTSYGDVANVKSGHTALPCSKASERFSHDTGATQTPRSDLGGRRGRAALWRPAPPSAPRSSRTALRAPARLRVWALLPHPGRWLS